MNALFSAYTVGRGRPPLHTRFKKGQSGNPSGKAGPAKRAKQRFQRVLLAALEGGTEDLQSSQPENGLAAIAKQLALDAVAGRTAAQRLILSLLESESLKEAQAEHGASEPPNKKNETDPFSLLQGKNQGSEEELLDAMLRLLDAEIEDAGDHGVGEELRDNDAPVSGARERNEAAPLSLQQGKNQGSEIELLEAMLRVLDAESDIAGGGGGEE